MLSQYLQATITVLSLINPAICIAIFNRSESDRSRSERYRDAAKASLAVATILVISALLRTRILRAFGLSPEAFMVAGGIVLSWMGFAMLRQRARPRASIGQRGWFYADIAVGVGTLVLWGCWLSLMGLGAGAPPGS